MALRPTPAIVEDDDQAKASDTADVGVGRQGCEAPKLRNLDFSATSEYRISTDSKGLVGNYMNSS
jgi:hypothetical protein